MSQQHRPTGWISRALVVRTLVCLGLLAAPATFPLASATFTGATANDVNAVSTPEVAPPSGLAATQTCAPGPGITARGTPTTATGVGSLTLTPPGGTVAGDLLVAQVTNRDGAHALTAPAGWTAIEERTTAPGSSTVTSALFWKRAVVGEPASTFTLGMADVQMVGGMVAYDGVHASSPVDDSAVASATEGVGTVATAPSVSTTTVGTVMLVHAFAKRQERLPVPGGTTPLWSVLSGSGAGNLGATAGSVPFAGPGATPTKSTTGTNDFQWVAHTVALRPAPGAPSANLAWTASPSTWATGYRLERTSGGTAQPPSTVTPISATSTVDGPLVNGTTYTYRLWAYHGTWTSSAVSATLTPSC